MLQQVRAILRTDEFNQNSDRAIGFIQHADQLHGIATLFVYLAVSHGCSPGIALRCDDFGNSVSAHFLGKGLLKRLNVTVANVLRMSTHATWIFVLVEIPIQKVEQARLAILGVDSVLLFIPASIRGR